MKVKLQEAYSNDEFLTKIKNGEFDTVNFYGTEFSVTEQNKSFANYISQNYKCVAYPYVYKNDLRVILAFYVDGLRDFDIAKMVAEEFKQNGFTATPNQSRTDRSQYSMTGLKVLKKISEEERWNKLQSGNINEQLIRGMVRKELKKQLSNNKF